MVKQDDPWIKTTVYLGMKIRAKLKGRAMRNKRSLSQEIAIIIEKEVSNEKTNTKPSN